MHRSLSAQSHWRSVNMLFLCSRVCVCEIESLDQLLSIEPWVCFTSARINSPICFSHYRLWSGQMKGGETYISSFFFCPCYCTSDKPCSQSHFITYPAWPDIISLIGIWASKSVLSQKGLRGRWDSDEGCRQCTTGIWNWEPENLKGVVHF